jgi:hypothetical protein
MSHACFSTVIKTCLSNIRFRYEVSISHAYSSPFSRLSYVSLSTTWWFASKSNCCCKLWVTIWFIFVFKVCCSFCSPYDINHLNLWYFLPYPFKLWIRKQNYLFEPFHLQYMYNNRNCKKVCLLL